MVYERCSIKFIGEGTERSHNIKAETAGKVFIEGVSDLEFGGKYCGRWTAF